MSDHPDMSMHQPGAAHEKLHPFVGKFRAEVKLWMGPGDPMVTTGVMENSMDLDGRYLYQHYQGDPNDGPFPEFQGRGFWGYNTFTNKYQGFWADNASTAMQLEEGEVDETGKVWTMQGESPSPHGGTMQRRTVIKLIDDDHHSMVTHFLTPDGNEFKGMDIQYERIKS